MARGWNWMGMALAVAATLVLPAEAGTLPPGYVPPASLAPLVDSVKAAVVNLDVTQEAPTMPAESLFPLPFDLPSSPHEIQGKGTGFLVSADGYILTNNHVVDEARAVKVTFQDRRQFDAKVVGRDDRTDIALLKIDAKEALPWVELGSSDAAQVGDFVMAIGNPFGLGHTVTTGIISAKGRVIGAGPYDDFIQVDASINPGNSGGPLFDAQGSVIGINTAINASAQGIGFAVPIDMVKPVLDELKTEGRVARGWLGVELGDAFDAELAQELGAPPRGALVASVFPGTPGQKAGLQASDVIVAIDGRPVSDRSDFVRAIGARRPGDRIVLEIYRDGKRKEVPVVLGERPLEKELVASVGGGSEKAVEVEALGIKLEGTRVAEVDPRGPAARGLRVGDVIVGVGRDKVRTAVDLARAISAAKSGVLLVFVEREGAVVFVPLRLKVD
jgi:serine protease Do